MVDQIFLEFPGAASLSFDDFSHYNRVFSSEMFFSLMALLHEKLPCAPNIFRLKRVFRKQSGDFFTVSSNGSKSPSSVRSIASPKMMKGLSLFKCHNFDVAPYVSKHISSSTNDEIEEEDGEELIDSFEPIAPTRAIQVIDYRRHSIRKNSTNDS